MSDTSIQTVPSPVTAADPAVAPEATPAIQSTPPTPPRARNPVVRVLEVVGSFRVTVTLFVLGLILVFLGTLAQIDGGIWNVMDKYFRSFFVWIPLQLLVQFAQIFIGVSKETRIGGSIPFPGGFAIAVALLINLVAAYSLRIPSYFKRWKSYAIMIPVVAAVCLAGYLVLMQFGQWGFLTAVPLILGVTAVALAPFRQMIFFPGNRIGIITLHVGLVVMLVGEFITAYGALEGHMSIAEGETTNAVVHTRYPEIAFVDSNAANKDHVTVIPTRFLKPGQTIKHENLPCDVIVEKWIPVSGTRNVKADDVNPATAGFGLSTIAVEQREVAGASSEQTVDTPSTYVTLKDKSDGKSLGTYLLSTLLKEQQIVIDGKEYDVSLRFKHTYKPYSVRLEEFSHDVYPGTDKPRNFSSLVTLRDEERGDDRQVLIRMNEPLRHRGDTYFQANWDKVTGRGTVLQVVRNPAWQLPYWSCAIVSLGMLLHFGLNLINFLSRKPGEPSPAA